MSILISPRPISYPRSSSATVPGRNVRSPHVPRTSRSVAATAPSGSASTSGGDDQPACAAAERAADEADAAGDDEAGDDDAAAEGRAGRGADQPADGERDEHDADRDPRRDAAGVGAAVVAQHADQQVDDRAGDREQRHGGAPGPVGQQDRERGDGQQAGAERAREAPLDGRRGRVVARDEEQAEQVGDDADPAGEDEDHERDPDRERVDVEVAAEAAGDAADHAVGRRARQAPRWLLGLWVRGRGLGHGAQSGAAGRVRPLGMTLSEPYEDPNLRRDCPSTAERRACPAGGRCAQRHRGFAGPS